MKGSGSDRGLNLPMLVLNNQGAATQNFTISRTNGLHLATGSMVQQSNAWRDVDDVEEGVKHKYTYGLGEEEACKLLFLPAIELRSSKLANALRAPDA